MVYVGPLQSSLWTSYPPIFPLKFFFVSLLLALPGNRTLGSHEGKQLLPIIFNEHPVGRAIHTNQVLSQVK